MSNGESRPSPVEKFTEALRFTHDAVMDQQVLHEMFDRQDWQTNLIIEIFGMVNDIRRDLARIVEHLDQDVAAR